MWPKDMRGKPMRDQLGEAIHRFADRLSPATARRLTGMSFTYERGEGVRFRRDRRGCPIAYLSEYDYDRAHTEADTAP